MTDLNRLEKGVLSLRRGAVFGKALERIHEHSGDAKEELTPLSMSELERLPGNIHGRLINHLDRIEQELERARWALRGAMGMGVDLDLDGDDDE